MWSFGRGAGRPLTGTNRLVHALPDGLGIDPRLWAIAAFLIPSLARLTTSSAIL
jgi:hypothetical protein